ncbi:capsule assembly Wzi family protein [Arsenicibacter rosenii]|uniref:Capsule assembly Wzi family protein n=1 Tax=Arsenicibacter rosenii TaxID=1750698 RepID=A0A1S2VLW0_9BACT|nr:capsule assembly Wzi family protein [Arsenicibacter rosenii]OIN58788.1 hypothetical protein BLX24_11155 [Arsenicibacter rosenii]
MPRLLNLLGGLLLSLPAMAQTVPDSTSKPASYTAELGGVICSTNRTPFWLRANQFGLVPLNGSSATLRLGTTFERPLKKGSKWAAGYGAYVVGNVGATNQVLVPEAYGRIRRGALELWAGRRRQVIGLTDTLLTSGSYSWSGNALPITRVQFGTTGFVPIGFTKGVLAINAFMAHGWFPAADSVRGSFLHQKAVYGRIGKPSWPVRIYGGLLHNVQWGGYSTYRVIRKYGGRDDGKLPSSFRDYLYMLVAKQPKGFSENLSSIDTLNQIGNHLGNIDLAIEVAVKNWNVLLYNQHPFEDKSGLIYMNFPDGIYGIRLKNTNTKAKGIQLKQFTVEYVYTVDQSGLTHTRTDQRYGGGDNYFNHSQYRTGWVVDHNILGTPFITRWQDVRPGLTNTKDPNLRVITNNKIKVAHLGFLLQLPAAVLLEGRASYSHNLGSFVNKQQPKQFSGILKAIAPIFVSGQRFDLNIALAIDQGELYVNSIGGFIGIRKTW